MLTRYVQLNLVRASMVADPADWPWSSYRGYARTPRCWDWVAHGELLAPWQGAFGGSSPDDAHRQFVTAGVAEPPPSPLREARHGWILGSEAFAESLRRKVGQNPPKERRRETRRLFALDLDRISEVVVSSYDIAPSELRRCGSRHSARAALAYLARRYTSATNAQLVPALGLSRPESVPNLTRRLAAWAEANPELREQLTQLEEILGVVGAE